MSDNNPRWKSHMARVKEGIAEAEGLPPVSDPSPELKEAREAHERAKMKLLEQQLAQKIAAERRNNIANQAFMYSMVGALMVFAASMYVNLRNPGSN